LSTVTTQWAVFIGMVFSSITTGGRRIHFQSPQSTTSSWNNLKISTIFQTGVEPTIRKTSSSCLLPPIPNNLLYLETVSYEHKPISKWHWVGGEAKDLF
jgi:hypothetical protein